LSLEAAALRRQRGELGYTSVASERQAAKQRLTRQLKRMRRRVDDLSVVETPRGEKYHIGPGPRKQYFELRQAKLNGEFIPDGDWHLMMDMARELEDPALKQLRASPDVMEGA
jgi:hypothetical protein